MTYSAGEALIATQVQNVSGFSSANVSRGDWGIMNNGVANVYAILRPGPMTIITASARVENYWRTVVEVWQRYQLDGTTLTTLEANTTAVKTRLNQYGRMGDSGATIDEARVTGAGDVVRVPPPPEGTQWLVWELYVDWSEQEAMTYAE
jgi:hypothetical protein